MIAPATEDLSRMQPERLEQVLGNYIGNQAYEIDHFDRTKLGTELVSVEVGNDGRIQVELKVNQEADFFFPKMGQQYSFDSGPGAQVIRNAAKNEILIQGYGNLRLVLTNESAGTALDEDSQVNA